MEILFSKCLIDVGDEWVSLTRTPIKEVVEVFSCPLGGGGVVKVDFVCGDEFFKIAFCQRFANCTLIKILCDHDASFRKSHLHMDLEKFLFGFLEGCLVLPTPFDTNDWNLEIYYSPFSLRVVVLPLEICAAYHLAIFCLVGWYDDRHLWESKTRVIFYAT